MPAPWSVWRQSDLAQARDWTYGAGVPWGRAGREQGSTQGHGYRGSLRGSRGGRALEPEKRKMHSTDRARNARSMSFSWQARLSVLIRAVPWRTTIDPWSFPSSKTPAWIVSASAGGRSRIDLLR